MQRGYFRYLFAWPGCPVSDTISMPHFPCLSLADIWPELIEGSGQFPLLTLIWPIRSQSINSHVRHGSKTRFQIIIIGRWPYKLSHIILSCCNLWLSVVAMWLIFQIRFQVKCSASFKVPSRRHLKVVSLHSFTRTNIYHQLKWKRFNYLTLSKNEKHDSMVKAKQSLIAFTIIFNQEGIS